MSPSVELLGAGWGRWRGRWSSDEVLEQGADGWRVVERQREVAAFPSLEVALGTLWPRRQRRGPAPWAIGWLGYEACAALADDLPAHPWREPFPLGWWLLSPRFDGAIATPTVEVSRAVTADRWTSSLDDRAFRGAVATIRERIAAGDVYQVNLTRRFTLPGWTRGLDPLAEVVAATGWPDHAARFHLGRGGLLCASMELLLRRYGDRVETRPIKGTRPRGASPSEDRRLAAELEHDAKERAELAMIVDLERNDLGRWAVPGSTHVLDPGAVQIFPTVLHRVARVVATVPATVAWWQLVAAMAPGGSVTGCPKRAAMELIRTLEPVPRGPYTGLLGVVAGTGDLELALPIRTAWADGTALHVASGCGIVWDSDPGREEEESRLKVAPWLRLAAAS